MLFFYSSDFYAQRKITLIIYENNKTKEKQFTDSLQLNIYLNKHLSQAYSKAYIEAHFDNIVYSNDTVYAYFNKGRKFYFGDVKIQTNGIIPFTSNKFFKQNKKASNLQIEQNIETILNELENNGYPFAKIKFDSLNISENKINVILNIDKGKLITLDSVIIKGNTNTKLLFFKRYLKLYKTRNYNEKLFASIDRKLKKLDFITVKKTSDILFYDDKVKINLYIDKQKINRFDGIAGIIPNDKTSGKLAITGELRLYLKNSFGRAESIMAEWKKTDAYSQKLKTKFSYPYIFNTSLGVNTAFNFYKQDTTFMNIDMLGGVDFLVNYNSTLSLFVRQKHTKLLSVSQYQNINTLPEFAESTTNLLGANVSIKNLNRIYSPTKGYFVNINFSGGLKYLKKDSRLPAELYNGMEMKTKHIEMQASTVYYCPVWNKFNLQVSINVKYVANKNLFKNDLFRFGGLKSLRGFNED